jgi:isopenicillin-N epimerase
LIQQVEDLILNNEKEKKFTIKLALFEHINSSMGIVLPIKKLASICSTRGIEVLIDGAHAMGQIDLNIQDLGEYSFLFLLTIYRC